MHEFRMDFGMFLFKTYAKQLCKDYNPTAEELLLLF